jgi:hypothetical protein
LDRETQQFLLDREKHVEQHLTKRTQELSETQKKYERLDNVLKPYDEVAKTQGIDLAPHIAQAMQYYSAFNRDPASTIKALIQSSKLTAEQLGLVSDDTVDPAVKTLRNDLAQTRQEVASIKQGTIQQTNSDLQAQINAFKDAKDEKGNLIHPHFEQVRSLMAPIVDKGKTLDQAYSEVVWTLPEYREAQEKMAREKAEKEIREKAEKERTSKVKKAKEATTLPSSDAEKGNGAGKFEGWQKALQDELRQMQ